MVTATASMTTIPPQQQSILARLSATIGHNHQQSQSEQKLAQMRAAYSAGGTAKIQKTGSSLSSHTSNSLSSLPTEKNSEKLDCINSDTPDRRASVIANCLPSPSIMELAKSAGLLALNPSDLVFESSVLGIAYYDFVLSVSEVELAPVEQQKDTSPNKKTVAKRRVHETGSAPMKTTTNDGGPIVAPFHRKRGQTMEKGTGGRSLVAMLQKQRTEMQLMNSKNGTKPTAAHQNFAKGLMSEINEKCENEAEKKPSNGRAPSKSPTPPEQTKDSNTKTLYRIFLAKLDAHTNVQWFESVMVPRELLERNGIPVSELSLLTMGILVWRCTLNNARLLCLVNGMQQEQIHEDGNSTAASFEALKRAACKYKCMHHVLTIGQRRPSAASTHSSCSSSSRRSSTSSGSYMQHHQQDSGMKLRVLMCQSRIELPEFPAHALRDAKLLMASGTNPLFCLCFPLI